MCLVPVAAATACAPGDDAGVRDAFGDGDASTGDGNLEGGGDVDPDDGRTDVPPADAEICDEERFEIARVIPDMLVVLDRSNSMRDDGYWDPVRNAIYDVTAAMDAEIWFGLMIFPNASGGAVCSGTTNQCEPGREPVVGCAEGNAGTIRDQLVPMPTCGGTPIAVTLRNGRVYLDTLAGDGHPKFILLATDGAPNCNESLTSPCRCTGISCGLNPLNCLDDVRTYGVIDELNATGIRLFVLGIGTSTWMDVLDQMAWRGGTDHAFLAEDPASIRATFEEIAGSIASCEFDMRSPSPDADPNLVNFYFDGAAVPRDDDGECDNGWRWTDADHDRVVFCGTHCDALLGSTVTDVSATWGCPTILI
jgi:hypothetical protein